MVIIRLTRGGSKKRPFYHFVATDSRNRRDGSYLQRLGYFNPMARGQEKRLLIERENVSAWVAKGAQLSDRVADLIKEWDKSQAVQEVA